jgi:uncharacterized MAPEG superfamily protein
MYLTVDKVLLYSIIGAVVLVYFPYLWVAYGRFTVGYDVSAPRAMFDKLPAYAQRATWAHQNSFEALTIYSVAALTAYVTKVDSPLAIAAAIAFSIARFLFSLFYILDIPLGRSLMFGIGSACSITLFILSLGSVAAN